MGKSRGRPKLPLSSIKTVENLKHSTGSFRCDFCKKTFRSPTTLQRHLALHPEANQAEDIIKEPKFICTKCPKSYHKKRNLEKHMASHVDVSTDIIISGDITYHDLYPYECTECWVCFSEKSQLLSHQKTHNSTELYKCTKCNSSFSYRVALNRHMLTHATSKPYECKFCDATFDNLSARFKHAKIHALWCHWCQVSFHHMDELFNHIAKAHKNKDPSLNIDIPEESSDENSSESEEKEMNCEKSISGSTRVGKPSRKNTVKKLKSSSCEADNSMSEIDDKNELCERNAFKCHKCETGFESKASLEQHTKNCVFYFMCGSPRCKNVNFSTSKALSLHIAEKHKNAMREKTAEDPTQVEANEPGSAVPNNRSFNFTESVNVLNSGMIQGNTFIPNTNQTNMVNPAVGVGNTASAQGNVFSSAMGLGGTALVQGNASNSGMFMFQVPNKPATYQFPGQLLSSCFQSPQSIVPNQVTNPLVCTGFTPQCIDPATAYKDFDVECYIPWFQNFCEMCKSLQYPLEASLFDKLTHILKCLFSVVGNPLNQLKEEKNFSIVLQLFQEMLKIAVGHVNYITKNIKKC